MPMRFEDLDEGDREAVESFSNFLVQAGPPESRQRLSPAAWAFVLGATHHCPAPGVM